MHGLVRQQRWKPVVVLEVACAPATGRVDTTRLTVGADSAVRRALGGNEKVVAQRGCAGAA